MSLDRMWDNIPLSKSGYDQAFAEVRAGVGSLGGDVVARYMESDPVNAVYLQTESIKLMRDSLQYQEAKAIPKYGPKGKYMRICHPDGQSTIEYRSQFLEIFDKFMLVKDPLQVNADTYIVFHNCVFCDSNGGLNIARMNFTPETAPMYGMFDGTNLATSNALTQFLRIYAPNGVKSGAIMGFCSRCYKRCAQCDKSPSLPHTTYEELESYYSEQVCLSCSGNGILKLPVPKPSVKDLRVYRAKLISLRKET